MRRPWAFDLSRVRVPVKLWHGEICRNVPVAHAHRMATQLPDCEVTLVSDAGHYLVVDPIKRAASLTLGDVAGP